MASTGNNNLCPLDGHPDHPGCVKGKDRRAMTCTPCSFRVRDLLRVGKIGPRADRIVAYIEAETGQAPPVAGRHTLTPAPAPPPVAATAAGVDLSDLARTVAHLIEQVAQHQAPPAPVAAPAPAIAIPDPILQPPTPPLGQPAPPPPQYSEAADRLFALRDRHSRFGKSSLTIHVPSRFKLTAVLSDLHLPKADRARMVKAIVAATEVYGCTEAIGSGDIADMECFSHWPSDKTADPEGELHAVAADMDLIAASFQKFKLIRGNHDGTKGKCGGRWERWLESNIPAGLRFLLRDPWQDVILKQMKHSGRVEEVGVTLEWGGELRWIYAMGDAVFAHWLLTNVNQGANVLRLFEWIREWHSLLPGVPRNPRFVLTGHTHRGTELHGLDHMLVEAGMLASFEAQEYQLGASGRGSRRPGTFGWVLLVQDENGRTDLSQSGFKRVDP